MHSEFNNAFRLIIASENSGLTDPIIDKTTTALNHTAASLSNAKTNYWRVFAVDAAEREGHGSQIRSFDAQSWSLVAAGGDHTVALKANGEMWAWGSNCHRQLGIGSKSDQLVSILVPDNWL